MSSNRHLSSRLGLKTKLTKRSLNGLSAWAYHLNVTCPPTWSSSLTSSYSWEKSTQRWLMRRSWQRSVRYGGIYPRSRDSTISVYMMKIKSDTITSLRSGNNKNQPTPPYTQVKKQKGLHLSSSSKTLTEYLPPHRLSTKPLPKSHLNNPWLKWCLSRSAATLSSWCRWSSSSKPTSKCWHSRSNRSKMRTSTCVHSCNHPWRLQLHPNSSTSRHNHNKLNLSSNQWCLAVGMRHSQNQWLWRSLSAIRHQLKILWKFRGL